MNHLVRDGYDRIADLYTASRSQFDSLPYIERFVALLPAGGSILDIGCGGGEPVARSLVERGFVVTGLDISSSMVELAKQNVPTATFEVRDMLTLKPAEFAVDGIVALYSIFHVPREEHPALLRTLRTYLPRPGAVLLTMGAGEWQGTEPDFHGVEMFWSHFGPERNREMLEDAGFTVVVDEIAEGANERHQVLIART